MEELGEADAARYIHELSQYLGGQAACPPPWDPLLASAASIPPVQVRVSDPSCALPVMLPVAPPPVLLPNALPVAQAPVVVAVAATAATTAATTGRRTSGRLATERTPHARATPYSEPARAARGTDHTRDTGNTRNTRSTRETRSTRATRDASSDASSPVALDGESDRLARNAAASREHRVRTSNFMGVALDLTLLLARKHPEVLRSDPEAVGLVAQLEANVYGNLNGNPRRFIRALERILA